MQSVNIILEIVCRGEAFSDRFEFTSFPSFKYKDYDSVVSAQLTTMALDTIYECQ